MPYVYLYTNAEAKAKEQVASLKIVTIAENDIELRTDDFISLRSSWQKACLHIAIKTPLITGEQINKQLVMSLDKIHNDDSNNNKYILCTTRAYATCMSSYYELVSSESIALPCIRILQQAQQMRSCCA